MLKRQGNIFIYLFFFFQAKCALYSWDCIYALHIVCCTNIVVNGLHDNSCPRWSLLANWKKKRRKQRSRASWGLKPVHTCAQMKERVYHEECWILTILHLHCSIYITFIWSFVQKLYFCSDRKGGEKERSNTQWVPRHELSENGFPRKVTSKSWFWSKCFFLFVLFLLWNIVM